jgi:hypothetical protein
LIPDILFIFAKTAEAARQMIEHDEVGHAEPLQAAVLLRPKTETPF